MKTYDDYTEIERANLTAEQVENLLKYELMKRGILMPQQPVLESVPETVVLEKTTAYQIMVGSSTIHALFETSEKALDAARLMCGYADTEYPGSYRDPVTILKDGDARAIAVQVVDQATYAKHQSALRARSLVIDRNEKTIEEFRKASKQMDEAVEWVWNDWREKCAQKWQAEKVQRTFAEYLQMCEGNAQLASRFLDKVFSAEEIADAKLFVQIDYLPPEVPPVVDANFDPV